MFKLDEKRYVLGVKDDDTVIAIKDPPGEEEGQRVAYFVPNTVGGPFEKLVLMDTTKDLPVNMTGETLTIKEWQDTKSSYQSFVIENIS